jgi:hypothetical protein
MFKMALHYTFLEAVTFGAKMGKKLFWTGLIVRPTLGGGRNSDRKLSFFPFFSFFFLLATRSISYFPGAEVFASNDKTETEWEVVVRNPGHTCVAQ